jgi:hypothetical protein
VKEKKIFEDTDRLIAALIRGMAGLQFMIASATSVCYGSNEAVALLYLVP